MNGIFLHILLREIRDQLIGRRIEALLVDDRLIQIVLDRNTLIVSLHGPAAAILLGDRRPGFVKLTVFGDAVLDRRITGVVQEDFKPVVRLILEDPSSDRTRRARIEVIISLYRDGPNIRIMTGDYDKQLFARFIERPAKKSIADLTPDQISGPAEETIRALSQYDGLDRNLIRELSADNLARLKAITESAPPAPKLISVRPLQISLFAGEYIREYPSMNDLLNDWLLKFLRLEQAEERRAQQAGEKKKLHRRLARMKQEILTPEAIEENRIKGELILANSKKIEKGAAGAVLFNHYTQQNTTVGLDPSKNAGENARDYFTRYKKLKRGQPVIMKRIKDLEQEIKRLDELPAADTPRPLHLEREKLSDVGARFSVRKKAEPKDSKPRPFREFPLASGAVVYVGKNARSNEKLTFKFAGPHDYFFHARAVEGAHAILKARVPRGQKPSRNDLAAAASVAAYFSKARPQKKVPVSYTQRKYLKKNKKGKPGSVILMREEVIFVDPALPASAAAEE